MARNPPKGGLVSEDLLIRSHHETVTNILPFLCQMGFRKSELVSFTSKLPSNRTLGADEAVKDNFKVEDAIHTEVKAR